MNGKISLTCKRCNCKMEFLLKCTEHMRPIVCQNCGQELSASDFSLVKTAMDAINALPYASEIDGWIPDQDGFRFEIEIAPSPLPSSEC